MGTDIRQLEAPFRQRVAAVIAQANGRVTIESAYRTRAEQIDMRKRNCGTSDYDIYQRPPAECTIETAIPGTSEHEKGLAVDFGGDLDLAHTLGAKWGIRFPLPREPWHAEPDMSVTTSVDGLGTSGRDADSLGDAIGIAGGVAKGVPVVGSFVSAAEAGAAVAGALLNPRTWLRVLAVIGGVILVAGALFLLARDAVPSLPIPTPVTA